MLERFEGRSDLALPIGRNKTAFSFVSEKRIDSQKRVAPKDRIEEGGVEKKTAGLFGEMAKIVRGVFIRNWR